MGGQRPDPGFQFIDLRIRLEPQPRPFGGADLGGTRLSLAYNLSDMQIEGACSSSDTPPVLPAHLDWTARPC